MKELLADILSLQCDIMIHGCTPTRRKRIYKKIRQLIEACGLDVTDEEISCMWYEG